MPPSQLSDPKSGEIKGVGRSGVIINNRPQTAYCRGNAFSQILPRRTGGGKKFGERTVSPSVLQLWRFENGARVGAGHLGGVATEVSMRHLRRRALPGGAALG